MPKLLLDGMLGRLATWCRLLGIDSLFSTTESDSEMMERARSEDRILVTMDRELVDRCLKNSIKCISISSKRTEEQIAQIISVTGTPVDFPNNMRCPACNGILVHTSADEAKGSVPEDMIKKSPNFWRCPSCGKSYWEGSHWPNILAFYSRVKSLI